MPALKRVRVIQITACIMPVTLLRLNAFAARHGIRRNKLGVVMDATIDRICDLTDVEIDQTQRGLWRQANLKELDVRAIRKSRDKTASLAAHYKISENTINRIRRRDIYKWVK